MASLSIERERQAREELGVTSFARGVKGFLFGCFVAIVGGGTAWHVAAELADAPAWPRALDPTRLLPGWEELRVVASEAGWPAAFKAANDRIGVNIADYEVDLEDRSPVIEALVPTVNALVTAGLRGSTESVYPGRQGWWFYRPDIDYVTGPGFLTARARSHDDRAWDPVPALDEFQRGLAGRGIELIVAPVPAKPTIYPERFSSRLEDASTAIQNPSYERFLERLAQAGIRHVDLGPVLMRSRDSPVPLFLATDTHWSPTGVAVAAGALAASVTNLDVAWQLPPLDYTRSPVEVTGLGDTVAMLDVAVANETVTAQTVYDPEGRAWAPDANAEILLLGDSFANIYSLPTLGWGSAAGLAAQLSAELGRPVDTLTINDNGSYATRATLASAIRRGRDRLADKKVVVYQFACRELAFGDWRIGFRYGS